MNTRTAQALRFLADVTTSALVGWDSANREQRELLLQDVREHATQATGMLQAELEPARPKPGDHLRATRSEPAT